MSFFTPPPLVTMRVFAQLPKEWRRQDTSAWSIANRPHARTDSFLEGPTFDEAGNLYVTDIPFGRIFRINPSGGWELVVEYDGWPNGMRWCRDGTLLIADFKNGLMTLNPETGGITSILATVHSEGFKGINDLTFGPHEKVYFTDQGQSGMHDPSGRVYRLDANGTLTRLLDTGPSPNGLALDPSGRSLFVAMTRAHQIWRIPLPESGLVGKVGVFSNLHGGMVGPDGLAFDEAGNLFVAHAGMGIVWGLTPEAVPFVGLKSPTGAMTTNMAFGGVERKQLYLTESETGTILVADLDVPGLRIWPRGPIRGGEEGKATAGTTPDSGSANALR